ncbi:MAG: Crp/Fnr family transcriptional regulator [Bosea sp.]|jgi:CRP-like cAMP-binding protein|uniref:Crp/Fnr family transcriptional regulator n=1 Tax=Bosea sp. (in: a-proteobacteria) TaxID=1871050 RepID=UPI001ACDD21B|nr:Crp/Fnr family transcriptional regulator [Bosea sp. (in: a-proteobacteria)]MBN9451613.1 Crp/Fnr family transcriptional regulator [Bosea sp. (in: a-proteobacteria)]
MPFDRFALMAEHHDFFLRKLSLGTELSPEDRSALVGLCTPARRVEPRTDLADEGSPRGGLILVLSGWACRYRVLANGNRQITGLLLPGDFSQPFGITPQRWSCSLMALTPATVCELSPRALRSLALAHPTIEDALWLDLYLERDFASELIVSLGRRSASERLACMLCEIYSRLKAVGLVDERSFDLPVTQADLADLLGLSAVHINRSLMDLRRRRLITWHGRRFEILRLHELLDLAQVEPVYSASLLSGTPEVAHG